MLGDVRRYYGVLCSCCEVRGARLSVSEKTSLPSQKALQKDTQLGRVTFDALSLPEAPGCFVNGRPERASTRRYGNAWAQPNHYEDEHLYPYRTGDAS